RRSEPEVAGSFAGTLSGCGCGWPQAASMGHSVLRLRAVLWAYDLCPPEELAGASRHAGNLGVDLRNLQNVSRQPGQVSVSAVDLHRCRDRAVFRRAATLSRAERHHHSLL